MADNNNNNKKSQKTKRPNRITMEGMIWNANHVLEAALDPDNHGVSAELFEKCEGIVLLSVVQAGLVFTGHYGSGVMMAKQRDENGNMVRWSPPVAAGAMGYGGGAFVGAEVEDVLIFILDKDELTDFATRPQTRLNITGEVTVGKHGREANLGLEAPHHKTVSVVFYKGVFGGFGLEMGTLQIIKKANAKFYGVPNVKTEDILFKDSGIETPADKGIEELHKKLSWLAAGQTWRPGAEDVDKSERLREKAELAGEQAKEEHKEDIQLVEAPLAQSAK